MAKVLIVDDDPTMCTVVADKARRMGLEAVTASTTDHAELMLSETPVDLLITDLDASGDPTKTGLDLVKFAKSKSPRVASVLMSTHASASDYKKALQHGVVEVLTKPFEPEDLEAAIKKALDSHHGLQGSIHGLDLPDLLQIYHMGKRSLDIEIGDGEGVIHMKDGEIIHARYQDSRGEAALGRLLELPRMSVTTLPRKACEVTITKPFEVLLLTIAKEQDEANRLEPAPVEEQPSAATLAEDLTPPRPSLSNPQVASVVGGQPLQRLTTGDALPHIRGSSAAPKAPAKETDNKRVLATQSSPVPSTSKNPSSKRRDSRQFRYHEVLGEKYQLERSIARGGMGHVFLATQLPLGREVAVKVLVVHPENEDFRSRFLLEASTCARLSHPNIVTIHDYGQTKRGDVFMAMEYLQGLPLSKVMHKEKRLSPIRACNIVAQTARALRAAHKNGVVHRDLKPSNIMLLQDTDDHLSQDFIKVVDFGLAKLFEVPKDADALQLTRAGMLLGSPRYMSPEQIRNKGVDPRTDIYSLGVIFFIMLTGKPPFDADNMTDILTQHLRDPAPDPNEVAPDADIPEPLTAIVLRCLEKNPEKRYQNTEALLSDLSAQLGSSLDASIATSSILTTGTHRQIVETASAEPEEDSMSSEVQAHDSSRAWWALAIILFAVVATLLFWAVVLS